MIHSEVNSIRRQSGQNAKQRKLGDIQAAKRLQTRYLTENLDTLALQKVSG